MGKVLSALTNMVKDAEIRKALVENEAIWSVLASAITRVDHKKDEGSRDLSLGLIIDRLLIKGNLYPL